MLPRKIQQFALEALEDLPVLLINGARQTGKSTLAQSLKPDIRYTVSFSLVVRFSMQQFSGFPPFLHALLAGLIALYHSGSSYAFSGLSSAVV